MSPHIHGKARRVLFAIGVCEDTFATATPSGRKRWEKLARTGVSSYVVLESMIEHVKRGGHMRDIRRGRML